MRGARDVATIPAPGDPGGSSLDLEGLSDQELARRVERLRAENRRAFSDRRALFIDRLVEEQERRRHEREWDASEKAKQAEAEAAAARAEAEFQAEQAQRREALAVEQRMVAVARARSDREAELAAEERAIEERQARVRWVGLGAVGAAVLAGLGYALSRKRRAG